MLRLSMTNPKLPSELLVVTFHEKSNQALRSCKVPRSREILGKNTGTPERIYLKYQSIFNLGN